MPSPLKGHGTLKFYFLQGDSFLSVAPLFGISVVTLIVLMPVVMLLSSLILLISAIVVSTYLANVPLHVLLEVFYRPFLLAIIHIGFQIAC